MPKGFSGLGRCCRCGDTIGPWSLVKGIGWLCDQCTEEEESKEKKDDNTKTTDDER